MQKSGWTREWSHDQLAPYMHGEGQWAGYDDLESMEIKVHVFD
jgi:hypothetical protein